jgi:thiol-disulfide isomerase/thioredoxin
MAYLTAAVVIVGVLCALDLVLTLGVIRRLRDHTDRLSTMASDTGEHHDPDMMLPKGATVGGFSALTTDSEAVALELIDGPTLVGFFSPSCEPCKEHAPQFASFAAAMPGGRSRVLAVVVGEREDAEEFVGTLGGVARVVVEPSRGPLSKAFRVDGFPAVGLVDEHGTVLDSGHRVDRLTELATL